MGRDFSPREQWLAHRQFPDLHFSNIKFTDSAGRPEMLYTEEELRDRREHPHMQVLGADIYGSLRKALTDAQFGELEAMLGKLVAADMEGRDAPDVPEPVKCWYFNRHGHHYHEPNDDEFFEYIVPRLRGHGKDSGREEK